MLHITLEQPGIMPYRLQTVSSITGEWGMNKMGYLFFYTEDEIPDIYLNKGTFVCLYLVIPSTHRVRLLRRFILLNWTYLIRGHKHMLALFANDIHYILRQRVDTMEERANDFSIKLINFLLTNYIGRNYYPFHPEWKGREVPEIILADDGGRWYEYYDPYNGKYVVIYPSVGSTAWDIIHQIVTMDQSVGFYISEVSNYRWFVNVWRYPWGKKVDFPYNINTLQTYDQRIKFDQEPTHIVSYVEGSDHAFFTIQPVHPYATGLDRYEVYEQWHPEEPVSHYFQGVDQVSLTAKPHQLQDLLLDLEVGDALIIKDMHGTTKELPVLGFHVSYNQEAKKHDLSVIAGTKGDRGW